MDLIGTKRQNELDGESIDNSGCFPGFTFVNSPFAGYIG